MKSRLEEGLRFTEMEGQILDKFLIDEFKPKICHEKDVAVLAFMARHQDAADELFDTIVRGPFNFINVESSTSPDEGGNYIVLVEMDRSPEMYTLIESLLRYIDQRMRIEKWYFKAHRSENTLPWEKGGFAKFVPQSPKDFLEAEERRIVGESRTDEKAKESQSDANLAPSEEKPASSAEKTGAINYKLMDKIIQNQISRSSKMYIKEFQKQVSRIVRNNQQLLKHFEDIQSDHRYLYKQLEMHQKREKLALLREQQEFKRIRELEDRLSHVLLNPVEEPKIGIPSSRSHAISFRQQPLKTSLSSTGHVISLERQAEPESGGGKELQNSTSNSEKKPVWSLGAAEVGEGALQQREPNQQQVHNSSSTPQLDEATSDRVSTYFSSGMAASERKDYHKAIECFTKITEIVPDEPRSYYNLAILYYRLKDYDTAHAYAERAHGLGAKTAEKIIRKVETKKLDEQTFAPNGAEMELPVASGIGRPESGSADGVENGPLADRTEGETAAQGYMRLPEEPQPGRTGGVDRSGTSVAQQQRYEKATQDKDNAATADKEHESQTGIEGPRPETHAPEEASNDASPVAEVAIAEDIVSKPAGEETSIEESVVENPSPVEGSAESRIKIDTRVKDVAEQEVGAAADERDVLVHFEPETAAAGIQPLEEVFPAQPWETTAEIAGTTGLQMEEPAGLGLFREPKPGIESETAPPGETEDMDRNPVEGPEHQDPIETSQETGKTDESDANEGFQQRAGTVIWPEDSLGQRSSEAEGVGQNLPDLTAEQKAEAKQKSGQDTEKKPGDPGRTNIDEWLDMASTPGNNATSPAVTETAFAASGQLKDKPASEDEGQSFVFTAETEPISDSSVADTEPATEAEDDRAMAEIEAAINSSIGAPEDTAAAGKASDGPVTRHREPAEIAFDPTDGSETGETGSEEEKNEEIVPAADDFEGKENASAASAPSAGRAEDEITALYSEPIEQKGSEEPSPVHKKGKRKNNTPTVSEPTTKLKAQSAGASLPATTGRKTTDNSKNSPDAFPVKASSELPGQGVAEEFGDTTPEFPILTGLTSEINQAQMEELAAAREAFDAGQVTKPPRRQTAEGKVEAPPGGKGLPDPEPPVPSAVEERAAKIDISKEVTGEVHEETTDHAAPSPSKTGDPVALSPEPDESEASTAEKEFELGKVAYQKENYEKALIHFFRFLEFKPNDPRGLYNLSILYYRLKDYEAARKNALKAVRLGAKPARRILKRINAKLTPKPHPPEAQGKTSSAPSSREFAQPTSAESAMVDVEDDWTTATVDIKLVDADLPVEIEESAVSTDQDSQVSILEASIEKRTDEVHSSETAAGESSAGNEATAGNTAVNKATVGENASVAETLPKEDLFKTGLEASIQVDSTDTADRKKSGADKTEEKDPGEAVTEPEKESPPPEDPFRTGLEASIDLDRVKAAKSETGAAANSGPHQDTKSIGYQAKPGVDQPDQKTAAHPETKSAVAGIPVSVHGADAPSISAPAERGGQVSSPDINAAVEETTEGIELTEGTEFSKFFPTESTEADRGNETVDRQKMKKAVGRLFKIGMKAYREKNYSLAERHFHRFIESAPDEPRGHYNLAIVQYRQKKYDQARAAGERALELGSASARKILNKIDKKQKLSRKDRVGRPPSPPGAPPDRHKVGEVPEFPSLSGFLEKGSRPAPPEPKDKTLVKQKKDDTFTITAPSPPEVAPTAEGASTEAPTETGPAIAPAKPGGRTEELNVIFNLGMAASEKKQYTEAVSHFTRYLELSPNEPRGHYNLAILHYRLKEYDRAHRHAVKAVKLGAKPARRILEKIIAKKSAPRRKKRAPIGAAGESVSREKSKTTGADQKLANEVSVVDATTATMDAEDDSHMDTQTVDVAELMQDGAVIWDADELEEESHPPNGKLTPQKDRTDDDIIVFDSAFETPRSQSTGFQPAQDGTNDPKNSHQKSEYKSRPRPQKPEDMLPSFENEKAGLSFQMGLESMNKTEYLKAVQHFTKVTNLEPEDPRGFYYLAIVSYRLKFYETAREHALRAKELGLKSAKRILDKIEARQVAA